MNSFNEGAKRVGVTQASLSIAIKRLEDEIGVKLFNRSKQGVSLTKEGKDVLLLAKKCSKLFDDQFSKISLNSQAQAFKLGVHKDFYTFYLYPKLNSLVKKSEGLKIFVRDSKDLTEAVIREELDAAIIISPHIPTAKLRNIKLKSLNVKMIGLFEKYPILKKAKNFEEFYNHPWVATPSPMAEWMSDLDNFCSGVIVNSEDEVKKLILNGSGIGETVVEFFTEAELKKLTVSPIPTRYPEASFYFVFLGNRPPPEDLFASVQQL